MDSFSLQWILLIGSSLLIFFISPWAKTKEDFFRGSKNEQAPGFWMLTSSLVISWLFAKSITNAANLGMSFGMVGGVAYAAYYLSFLIAGIIIYRMRTRGGYASLHDFLESKYGSSAVLIFSILIGIRLLNEVWSNNLVIGSYFGESGSSPFYLSIVVFTLLTVAYTLKGGLRSSLLTDLIQMVLFGVLLFVILGIILPKENGDIGKFVRSGSWTIVGGLDLFFVAIIQVFSYPFHDPVLT
ncbi:MAG: sodium:solute symporter, partial [Bacteroidota bacterium]